MKWILLDGRSQKNVTKFKVVVEKYPDKTIVLKNQKQLNNYMKKVKKLL